MLAARDGSQNDGQVLRRTPLCVLVAGAHREIAVALIDRLLKDPGVEFVRGADVTPCPAALRHADPSRFEYRQAHLDRRRPVDHLFWRSGEQARPFDTVVHLALEGDPARYTRKSHDFNVHCASHLLESSLRHGVQKFVFLSSEAVYKLSSTTDYRVDEESPVNLDLDAHPIVRDTVDAEFICRAKMGMQSMEVMVLRPSGVFSGGVVSGLSALFESRPPLLPIGFDPMINPTTKERLASDLWLALRLQGSGLYNVAGRTVGPLSRFLEERALQPVRVPAAVLKSATRLQRWVGRSRYHLGMQPHRLYFSLVLDDRKFERDFRSHEPMCPEPDGAGPQAPDV